MKEARGADEVNDEDREQIKDVERWLWRNGSRTSNEAIETFIRYKATEWRRAKDDGMDVLADSVADVLATVVAVLKDL